MKLQKLNKDFFNRDVLSVAPELIGKILVRKFDDGTILKLRITETEAYRGEEDKACHASKSRTPRTEVMYMEAGTIYVYLIYGMYQMLNFVTESQNVPQAVLIRGAGEYIGPGKLTKVLKITKYFNKLKVYDNDLLWIEDDGCKVELKCATRIGIDYAGEEWATKLWRWVML